MICWMRKPSMEALGFSTMKSAGKRAAKPDGQAVALVEEAVRQGDRHANSLEGKLLVEHNPETRKELAPFH